MFGRRLATIWGPELLHHHCLQHVEIHGTPPTPLGALARQVVVADAGVRASVNRYENIGGGRQ